MTSNGKKKVNWGIIGCAGIAKIALIPALKSSRNSKLVAIASRSQEKAEQFRKDFGIKKAYGSYEAILDDPEIDAVYIPLINDLHKEWSVKAMEKGKHVLCEKPLACNEKDAGEMAGASCKNNVLLMEAFMHRFHPQNQRVKEIITSGELGNPILVTSIHALARPSRESHHLSPEHYGGILFGWGCYCINIIRLIFDDEPNHVFAFGTFGETGVDVRVQAVMKFPNGRAASFDCGFYLKDDIYVQSYEVLLSEGRISVPTAIVPGWGTPYGLGKGPSLIYVTTMASTRKEDFDPVDEYRLEVEYFANCILEDRKLEPLGENGLVNTKVLDAIYFSAKKGEPISL